MAFHDDLSRTQQILLAIFCFPLLPFYLCYLCFSRSEEDKEKADNTGQTAEAKNDGQQTPTVTFEPDQCYVDIEIHPRYPTPQVHRKGSQEFPKERWQDNQGYVDVEIHPQHPTPHTHRKGAQEFPKERGQDNQGYVDIEIHPRYPTPQVHRKGAQEFLKERGLDNQGFKHDGGEGRMFSRERRDLHVYPWDRSCLKSIPLDLKQFKNLDDYAAKVNIRNSVESLVNALLQKAHSDLEKIRAIWIWVCHHIQYDVEGFHEKAKRSSDSSDVLQSGKAVCSGYAGLVEKMCSIAGIQCKTLAGYSKGAGYQPGKVFQGESDHAWNAVYLDGRWHLLDSTWGSGCVDGSCTKFTFRYNEFYFLTHPALFINDHFPEEDEWQLLKQKLTLQQFERNTWCHSEFYLLGLLAVSTETSVTETENGKATITIEGQVPTLFIFKLNGAEEHGLVTLQRCGMTLEVYPQQTGTHCLEIFAKSPKDTEKNYRLVLEYSLKCSSVVKGYCLPKDLIQPVGPSWLSEEKGILESSPRSPVIHTEDGRCTVIVTRSKGLDVFATIDSNSRHISEDTKRRHIWKSCHGSQVEFKIHLPFPGDFAFYVWVKKASEEGNHHCALSYLLSCPNKSVMWPVFPIAYNDWEENYELVTPLAGILPANRQVEFKLKLPGVDEASVKCDKIYPLTHRGGDFWEGACNTSGASQVIVRASKKAGSGTLWFLLEYTVENH